jgi:hypothetical protein
VLTVDRSIGQADQGKFKLARFACIHFYLNRMRIDAREGCGLCDSSHCFDWFLLKEW